MEAMVRPRSDVKHLGLLNKDGGLEIPNNNLNDPIPKAIENLQTWLAKRDLPDEKQQLLVWWRWLSFIWIEPFLSSEASFTNRFSAQVWVISSFVNLEWSLKDEPGKIQLFVELLKVVRPKSYRWNSMTCKD